MAGSAVVGTLRALLTLDTADYDQALVRVSKASDKWTKDLGAMGKQATAVGKTLTSAITVPLVAMAGLAAKSAIDFESSFAGVRKTVDATDKEFAELEKGFRNLSKQIPINVNDLNRLGEAAGALGIPKKEIVDFSRVMAMLGVTTNLTADQAAESVAKIQTQFQAAGKETENFASALVHLGNNGASTEQEILGLATRISSAAALAKMSQADVLGFAAAMANVGIEAEAGGTALSRTINEISVAVSKGGDDLKGFAAVAGMSADVFAQKFKTDAAGAMEAFIAGLGRVRESGGNVISTLEELGIKEMRQSDTLRRLSLNVDNVSNALRDSRSAWQQNSALSEEARKRFETVSSQLALLWNHVNDVGITLGNALLPALRSAVSVVGALLPYVDKLAHWFGQLPGPVQMTAIGLAGLAAAAGPLIWAFGSIVTASATVTAAFGTQGIATKALTASMAGLRVALGFIGPAVGVAVVAFAGWQIGKHIGEVTGLTTAVQNLTERMLGLRNNSEPIESQQRTIAQAIQLGADKAVTFAEALQFLKDRAAKLRGEWESTRTATDNVTVATTAATVASGELAETTKEQEKAQKAAAKAADELEEATKRQEAAIRALGLVTRKDVVTAMEAFEETLKNATAAGIPVDKTLAAIRPRLIDLIANARASGIAVDDMVEALVELDQTVVKLRGGIPRLSAAISATVPLAKDLATGIKTITAEQQRAETQTYLTERAFGSFGMSTRAELRSVYDTAKRAYDDMLASGLATAEQLATAWGRVQEAGVAAGVVVVGAWEGTVKPVIMGFIQNISDAFSTSITDMLTGAASFSEGFSGIWSALKDVTRGAIDGMVSGFINDGLNAMLEGLEAWAIKAKLTMASFFTMAGLGFAAVVAGFAMVKMGVEWAKAFFGPHHGGGNEDGTATDPHEYDNYPEYFPPADGSFAPSDGDMPPQVPGFETGTNGRYVDFGAGTLAMLHGKEMITPEGSGGQQAVFIFQRDNREEARIIAPYLVGEVQRLQLSR